MKTSEDKMSIILVIFIAFILLFVLNGCSQYIYRSKPVQITHVLAITETGDTLKIPIASIKPNIIYNIIGYNYGPYYRPHSYNYYNYNYSRIRPYNDTRIRHSNSMYLSTFGIRSNKVKVNNSVIKRSGGVKKKNEN